MEDFQIHPEIVRDCAHEISGQCNGLESGGKTMHCLMGLANGEFKKNKQSLGPACKRAVIRQSFLSPHCMYHTTILEFSFF